MFALGFAKDDTRPWRGDTDLYPVVGIITVPGVSARLGRGWPLVRHHHHPLAHAVEARVIFDLDRGPSGAGLLGT